MTANRSYEESLHMRAERLCIEFCNTVGWHASAQPSEGLNTYDDLLNWSGQIGLLTEGAAGRLRRLAELNPARGQAVLQRAQTVREAIYHLLAGHAHGETERGEDLEILNACVADMMSHARLVPGPAAYAWGWDTAEDTLDPMLWPIVRSAVDLMTSPELERVGQCADDRGCGWLFLDMTKNRSRRWCDMQDCGNRAKARRHYERKKSAR